MNDRQSTINDLVAHLCDIALNGACKSYQDELACERYPADGGFAGMFFSETNNLDYFNSVIGELILGEIMQSPTAKQYNEFINSRKYYINLQDSPAGQGMGHEEPCGGFVYMEGAYIEECPSIDKYCLPLCRDEITSPNIADLEPILFLWCRKEGYFDRPEENPHVAFIKSEENQND